MIINNSTKSSDSFNNSLELTYLPSFEWFVMFLSNYPLIENGNSFYKKQHHCNRTKIATAQGPQLLTIPIVGGRNQTGLLLDIKIDTKENWKRKHINAIKTAYGKSPYFLYYFDNIGLEINKPYNFLYELNYNLIQLLIQQLSISGPLEKKEISRINFTYNYNQVFMDLTGFIPSCSIIDLIFNYGPDSKNILLKCIKNL